MVGRQDDGQEQAWATEEIRLSGVDDDARGAALPPRAPRDVPHAASPAVSARARASRRQRRQTLTFLAFFAVILLIGLLALAAYFDKVSLPWGSGRPEALPPCAPAPTASVQPARDTSVNVYNASNRNGLALNVARELQKRGFRVPTSPANDPQRTKMTTMAVIRHGPNGLRAAATVATVVAGPVALAQDERPGEDVDLVLGATFKLRAAGAASSSPSPAAAPSANCTPA